MLVASSLVVTAAVHARELPGTTMLDCTGTGFETGSQHEEGQSSKGSGPHQHGNCQTPMLDMAGGDTAALALGFTTNAHPILDNNPLRTITSAPALRPPQA